METKRGKKHAFATEWPNIVLVNGEPKVFWVKEQPKLFLYRFLAALKTPKTWKPDNNIKNGYLKRSQCYELAILRPFLALFPQTTLSTFTKARF